MQNKVKKAGAVILSSEDPRNVALLYRTKWGDWSFPKGHIDGGENETEAMLREIKEETGLDVKIIKELPDHHYINDTEGDVFVKMFLVKSLNDFGIKLEFSEDDIQWIPYNEVAGKLTYDNLKDYFKSIFSIIKKHT